MADPRICSVPDCGKKFFGRGWCQMHYARWRIHGNPMLGAKVHHLVCTIEGCGNPHRSRGWCINHYALWKKHGDPLGGGETAPGEALRYFNDVVLAYDGDDCLLWPYSTCRGYGQVWYDGRLSIASRIVCEKVHGPAPAPKLEAAHSCNRGHEGCVTKRHLRWATPLENSADKVKHKLERRRAA